MFRAELINKKCIKRKDDVKPNLITLLKKYVGYKSLKSLQNGIFAIQKHDNIKKYKVLWSDS